MGKKVSQASLKISKNEKQLHSLINVLRPKVYITDTSSFKRLVQELTGNGTNSITSTPPTMKQPDVVVENVPIIDIKDDQGDTDQSSMEASFASLEYSSELCHQVLLSEELNQVWNPIYLDDATFEDSTVNHEVGLLDYHDLESWLLEMEPLIPFYNDHAHFEQEVTIYDYELSGLI
jgi:hypothetical protein|uniref:VQ domain-containing protein n=1 Tax=Fagus sylvatica TaxID=28930 RepID=A0A2N9IBW4_FAGSY